MKLILASKSPRRREILENLGYEFEIITKDTDESSELADPALLVEELARRKGLAAAGELTGDCIVISSDTVVSKGGEILGKPQDKADARRMLRMLQGDVHSVFSGIALTKVVGGSIERTVSGFEETLVRFGAMTDEDIEYYISHEYVLDKAGAYAIQGLASLWIDGIEGDYFNVVGLPVRHMKRLMDIINA